MPITKENYNTINSTITSYINNIHLPESEKLKMLQKIFSETNESKYETMLGAINEALNKPTSLFISLLHEEPRITQNDNGTIRLLIKYTIYKYIKEIVNKNEDKKNYENETKFLNEVFKKLQKEASFVKGRESNKIKKYLTISAIACLSITSAIVIYSVIFGYCPPNNCNEILILSLGILASVLACVGLTLSDRLCCDLIHRKISFNCFEEHSYLPNELSPQRQNSILSRFHIFHRQNTDDARIISSIDLEQPVTQDDGILTPLPI